MGEGEKRRGGREGEREGEKGRGRERRGGGWCMDNMDSQAHATT